VGRIIVVSMAVVLSVVTGTGVVGAEAPLAARNGVDVSITQVDREWPIFEDRLTREEFAKYFINL